MLHTRIILLLIFFMSFFHGKVFAENPLIFGVFAYVEKEKVAAEYKPLLEFLNKRLGAGSVEMRFLTMDELDRAIAQHQLDVVTTNPTHFLDLRSRYRLSGPLATQMRSSHHHALSLLGGVIVTKVTNRNVNRLQDLSQKRIAVASEHHLGGYLAQIYELSKIGVELNKKQIVYTNSHEASLKALLAGEVDVAFVRTGVLEQFAEDGMFQLKQIKVINAQYSPYFANMLSTELFPEWPVFAVYHTDSARQRLFAEALMEFQRPADKASDGETVGYDIPADYMSLARLARRLHLPPYENTEFLRVSDIWHHWSVQSIALFGLFILLLLSLLLGWWMFRRLKLAHYQYELLLSSLGEGVFSVDRHGRCTFINKVAVDLLGYDEQALLHQHYHALVHHHHVDGSVFHEADSPIYQTLQDGQKRSGNTEFIRANGQFLSVRYTAAPIVDGLAIIGVEVVFQDVSEQLALQQKMFDLAHFDALTGCPNRHYFMQDLEAAFSRAKGTQAQMVLLLIDLDHFKRVNDHYGHAAGDAVLQAFVQKASHLLPADALLGRLGGEEFAVLFTSHSVMDASQWAEVLRLTISEEEVHFQGAVLRVTLSIGVAAYAITDGQVDSWLSRADALMYRAKSLGRNRVEVQ